MKGSSCLRTDFLGLLAAGSEAPSCVLVATLVKFLAAEAGAFNLELVVMVGKRDDGFWNGRNTYYVRGVGGE